MRTGHLCVIPKSLNGKFVSEVSFFVVVVNSEIMRSSFPPLLFWIKAEK